MNKCPTCGEYGKELILDIHDADTARFNRKDIDVYFKKLCCLINMKKCERFWWDDIGVPDEYKQTSPHTQGTSAVQFILTSSIVVHTLDQLGKVFINIFSCTDFDVSKATDFTTDWFRGSVVNKYVIRRD